MSSASEGVKAAAPRPRRELISLAIVAAGLAAAPFVLTGDYYHSVLVGFCVNLILLAGLNLISGYGRQVSLAQAGLWGLGAYAAGIAAAKADVPPLAAFFIAPVVVAFVAFVLGLPTLRLRGLYFVMATLGAGVVLFLVFGRAVDLTGGPNGLLGVPTLTVLGYELDTPYEMYWVAAALALVGMIVMRNLAESRTGLALRAAGTSEPGAASVGVDSFRVRLWVFVLSGVYAGFAGAIETFETRFISPAPFDFFASVILFVALTLGGLGTFLGPVVGALVIVVLDEVLIDYADYRPLVLGVVFLIAIQLFPRGIVGELIERWPPLGRGGRDSEGEDRGLADDEIVGVRGGSP